MIHGETVVRALSEESFKTSERLIEGLVVALEELKDFAFQLQDCAWRIVLVEEGSNDIILCGNLFSGHTLKPFFSRIS